MKPEIIFITGIGTNVGKTIVTGLLAKKFKSEGLRVITQKIVQTGCRGLSGDILKHREIMGEEPNSFDRDGITCPFVFEYPASPGLAAKLENTCIIPGKIRDSTKVLIKYFDLVLLEGAGGLHVPLNNTMNIIDYIQEENYPVMLVTNFALGSINHTLLSLEALKSRNIRVKSLICNEYPEPEEKIQNDSFEIFRTYLFSLYPEAEITNIPVTREIH